MGDLGRLSRTRMKSIRRESSMKIAIIGCGNIGAGIAKRLSKQHQILLYDRDLKWAEEIAHEGHGQACKQIKEAIQPADYVILAIKPQNLEEIADSINASIRSHQILISPLAGTSLLTLKEYFETPTVVRI